MVADAPGTCMPICTTIRDQWGNCVDEGCNSWYDGCNTCDINNNNLENCSENMCVDKGVLVVKTNPQIIVRCGMMVAILVKLIMAY